ncbi:MAG: sigma-70 family RNA polymerase sigma factor [Candidatus Latescibacteria bacterium]|nr:sigma-70 family RNA polymerase sigma factor [Candidatus Latescibacterota bacterium]
METTLLLAQARGGDQRAFAALVEQYQGTVYGYAYHLLGHFADAQDVAQDVFLEAHQKLDGLRHPERLAAWLRGITLNHCRRLQRQRQRQPQAAESRQLPDPKPGAEDQLTTADLGRGVAALLDRLTAPNRLAVALYYLDDCTYKHISQFLGVPLSTVKGRLHKSRIQLKQEAIDMVKEAFAANQLDPQFADQVLKRVGISQIGINNQSSSVWFATAESQRFVVRMPAPQAQRLADGPKSSLGPQRPQGIALSSDKEAIAARVAEPDIHDFIERLLPQFELQIANAVLDCDQDAAVSATLTVTGPNGTGSAALPLTDALLLSGRTNAPLYATVRVLETLSLRSDDEAALPLEQARQHEDKMLVRQVRQDIIGRALAEKAEQVRLEPAAEGAQVVFVKDETATKAMDLDEATWGHLQDDPLFTEEGDQRPFYGRHGNIEFTLTASPDTDDTTLVLDIEISDPTA